MSALPLEPHTEAEEATLKRIEGAEPAEESAVEKVARALAYEDRIAAHWDELREKHQRYYRRQAVAAVSALSSARHDLPCSTCIAAPVAQVSGTGAGR